MEQISAIVLNVTYRREIYKTFNSLKATLRCKVKDEEVAKILLEDLMNKGIEHALKMGADFAEAKGEDTVLRSIEVVNGEVRKTSEIRNKGIGIRIYYKKGNGFSFTNILDAERVKQAAETAFKIAKASSKKSLLKLRLKEVEKTAEKKAVKVKKHPRKVGLDEKKNLCMRQCDVAQHFDKRIVNVKNTFGEYFGSIYHINTDGTEVSHEPLLVGLRVECIAKENGILVDARARYGGTYGLEAFKQKEHTPETLGENAAKWAIEKLKAKPAPAGRFPTVINQRLCGVLAHESFGHMSEGDGVVIGMSPLTSKIGQQLGSTNVTIVDEGVPKSGGYKIFFDDEGVPCKRVEIMKNGVLRSYLHSRMTAHMLGAEPTGNARSQDHTYEPIVRMRNTFFETGEWKLEEALKGLKKGIYALDSAGGQASFDGTFLFKAVRGYWVEKGEIGHPLRDVALTGNILELLRNVDAVCDDLEIGSAPFGGCGKMDQRAYVGLGGPHLRIKDVLFGGMSK